MTYVQKENSKPIQTMSGFQCSLGSVENRWDSQTMRWYLERRLTDAWELFSECFIMMISKIALHGLKQIVCRENETFLKKINL